jgi:NAD(P)-dependent dehydrogenase (short-subunit alcohol dehydrogenase family)
MSTPRIVIVTGGAQNIGAAIAARFQAAGDTVICADLNEPSKARASPSSRPTWLEKPACEIS